MIAGFKVTKSLAPMWRLSFWLRVLFRNGYLRMHKLQNRVGGRIRYALLNFGRLQ